MADELLSLNDLLGFQKTVQQGSTLGQVGQGLGQWQPNMSTWTPAEQGITSFGKSFLSGLLGNMARADAADQLNKVVAILPALRSDPYNVAAPEGVDSDAYAMLKGTAILKNEANKVNQANALAEMMQKVGIAGLTKKAEVMGEAQGKAAIYGNDPKLDPDGPQSKKLKEDQGTLDSLRDKFNKLPEVVNYSQVNKAAQAMAGALKDKGAP